MTSAVGICNLALGNVGIQQTIASLDEKSKEAAACKRYYEQARDEVLEDYPWPFATRTVTLALVASDPTPTWYFSYRYPSDCSKVRRVVPPDIGVSNYFREPFIITSDASGKLVYSNLELALAEITAKITDTALFNAKFVNSLSWLLGSKIAPSLTGNNAKAAINHALSIYETSLIQAQNVAANEGNQIEFPYCETIEARS